MALTRRMFLVAGGLVGAGLAVGWALLPGRDARAALAARARNGEVALTAWYRIAPDGTVTVAVPRSEMGQGILTGLAMLVAEELEADWVKVRVEQAPIDPVYANATVLMDGLPYDDGYHAGERTAGTWVVGQVAAMLGVMATGGSTSVRDAWQPMREAGAMGRAMLQQAAAATWAVPVAETVAEQGRVRHPGSGRSLGYGELVEAASRLDPPATAPLKDPASYRLIGTAVPRLDIPAKVDGSARFGIDTHLPDMLFAAVRQAPQFGATLARFDAAAVQDRPGVVLVAEVPNGVAVVAGDTWTAQAAVDALPVDWQAGPHAGLTDARVLADLLDGLDRGEARSYREEGDPDGVLAAPGAAPVEAEYAVPYLAHACMEPMNTTARIADGQVEVWSPNQAPTLVKWLAQEIAGVDADAVTVHTPFLGGGFGRRAETDVVAQALTLATLTGGRPVKLTWSREEDMRHDMYRPAAVSRFRAVLDDAGRPRALVNRIAGPSVARAFIERSWPWMGMDLPDNTTADGAGDTPYDFGALRVEHVTRPSPVPVGFWRSVGHSYNAFFVESFIDELADRAGADPLAYRRLLLEGRPRHLAVLDLVAEKAGWGQPLPAGRARGLALHKSFGSIVGQVAEVSLEPGAGLQVHRVTCAVDCGQPVNPDSIAAQMEGGIAYGLSAALHGRITLADGAVVEGNFPDYPILQMAEMPAVEVHVVPSREPPGGVGEPGTPPIAPALANAVFALTGRRIRRLPLSPAELGIG